MKSYAVFPWSVHAKLPFRNSYLSAEKKKKKKVSFVFETSVWDINPKQAI